ncbi:MAG: hypothetical protein J1E16_11250 [Muribaculaceae bacterium]|nr:hypothetical protein [Muribaculaceae bacterium]
MEVLTIMLGLIFLFIIYFIGKGFLAILDFVLDILATLFGCVWFWIVAGVVSFILTIRILAT